MHHLLKSAALLMVLALIGNAQTISNVQFKDLEGNSYDLYAELAKGKSVLVHATGSG